MQTQKFPVFLTTRQGTSTSRIHPNANQTNPDRPETSVYLKVNPAAIHFSE